MYWEGGVIIYKYIIEEMGVVCMISIFYYEIDLKLFMKNIVMYIFINI